MGDRLLTEEDGMRGVCFEGRFRKMLGVVLSGILVLSVCTTAAFAEQIEVVHEDEVAGQNHVVGTQDTGREVGLRTMSDTHSIIVTNMYLDDNGEAQTGDDYGAVTPSLSQATKDTRVTLTVTPTDSELYTLYELTVTNANVPAMFVSLYYDDESNIHYFNMRDFDVKVTARFRKRHIRDNIEFEPWTSDNSLPNVLLPGNYYLTKDVTLSDTWNAPQGSDIPTNLCLNGHKITLNQNGEDSKPVIRVASSDQGVPCKLVLYDEDANEGAITHASGKLGCGVWVVNGGEFVMKGGNIANNAGDLRGGGVAVQGGTFTMDEGAIQNNGSENVRYGGGVYVGDGTFNLTGGTITQNTARIGGGVAGEYTYQISVSDSPRVTGNQAFSEHSSAMGNNLCLMWEHSGGGTPITIDGTLGEDARVGISTIRDDSPAESPGSSFTYTDGIFTSGYRATQSADPWNCFTSDDPGRQVLWTPTGDEAQLAVARHITVDQGITGGTVTLSKDVAAEGETIAIQAKPNEGWDFVSVAAKDADGKDVAVKDNEELVVPASDVVVSATFMERPAKPTPPTPVTVAKAARPKTVAYPSKRKVAVSWKAAKGAKTYQLQWRKAGAKKWTTASVEGGKKTVAGLKKGVAYEFRVCGVNGKVSGKWSKASPCWLKGAAKVKADSGKSTGSVKATWKADKAATGGFKVFVYAKKGGKLVKTKVVKAGATSATVKGLKSGKKYYVRVRPYRTKSGTTYSGTLSGWRSAKAK